MNIELHGGTIIGDIQIEAPPETVFDALTTPEDLASWWGAEGVYRTHDWEIDLRPGGAWHCLATSAGGQMTVQGVYLEVDRPTKLAYTWNPSWETIPPTTVRYTLSQVAGGTHVHFEHSGFDGQLKSQQGHLEGWKRVIEWLSGYLEGKGKAVAQ
ncbi:MAG: Activator of Hsp90 ATPase 1 family protein [Candidatus Solibacter sp.]|nr:Activator of Hsp90 ATPase 1 family protein [Candidatus Solibacter sp.]